jgi:serine/threonine-protein kinase
VTDVISNLATALGDRYRIERELGQGGMATVYVAEDLKHDRKVAIKVLRPELAAVIGAERFVREIKTIANLQHPHILGLIDSGEVGGTAYYVMPLVDGESLRDRLQREKQLPIGEAVRITTEVAGALDYAHRHGVIHRDIKPENILLHDGSALVADFGIALAASSAGTRMTETGMSLGTPQYMSPEQAMGEREITAASDVYALGCVTYEMLVGDPPFSGSTAQAIVAKIVTERPRSLIAQRHTIPESVDAAVLTAIEKLPADRFASAGEFAAALGNRTYTSATTARQVLVAARAHRFRDPAFVALAVVALAALGGGAALARRKPTAATLPTIRFVMAVTDSTHPFDNFPWPAAISPDGGTVVYSVVGRGNVPSLYALRTDQLAPVAIPGTAGAYQPYFSPDGQWLAFEGTGKEHKVRLDGSAPVTITDAAGSNGATWTPGNEIILGTQGAFAGLSRVNAGGGTAVALTHPDTAHGERNHVWPVSLSGGKLVAFSIWYGSLATARIAVASLSDGHVTPLNLLGIRPLAELDGMLLYVQADGAIMAVRLDAAGTRTVGTAIPVHDPVPVRPGFNGNSGVFVSSSGAMVSSLGTAGSRLTWLDFDGRASVIAPDARAYDYAKLAADEQQVAEVVITAGQHDIWIYDFALGTSSRLTTIGTVNSVEWAPDGKHVVYAAAGDSGTTIWEQLAAGGTPATRLTEIPVPTEAATMSPDGKALLVTALDGDNWDIIRVAVDSPSVRHRFLQSNRNLHNPKFSPDGKWVAIVSDESGQDEVYVRSYPDPSVKLQISAAGGDQPLWSADGSQIYYVVGTTLMRARLSATPTLALVGRDSLLGNLTSTNNNGGYFSAGYQVTRDGKRVLGIPPEANNFQLVISPNWITEFRKRVAESGGGK